MPRSQNMPLHRSPNCELSGREISVCASSTVEIQLSNTVQRDDEAVRDVDVASIESEYSASGRFRCLSPVSFWLQSYKGASQALQHQ